MDKYPTLPFALVFYLAQITPERATLSTDGRHVGIYAHKDRGISAMRLEITNDDQLSNIEAEVAKMFAKEEADTITLTFSTTDEGSSDLGVIIEKGKEPMIFTWHWSPIFGMTLVDDEETLKVIDTWSGVKLARDLMSQRA